MKKFVATVSAIALCLVLAGCGKDGKDGANGKDGISGKDGMAGKDGAPGKDGVPGKDGRDGKDGTPGKDGLTFRVVEGVDTAKCDVGETLASAICIANSPSPGVAAGFQTPNNAGEPNLLMATCPRLTVRIICTK